MLAMQYEFILPADYDMAIIYRRIRDKGHFLDAHQPLLFKAYLTAQRQDPQTRSLENRYAPFYLWRNAQGLSSFLQSPGFQGVVASFGRPSVHIWPAILAVRHEKLAGAAYAVRDLRPLPVAADLQSLHEEELAWAEQSRERQESVLALSALEPTSWSLVRFRLFTTPPPDEAIWDTTIPAEIQAYTVRHLSNPGGVSADFPEGTRCLR